MNKSKTVTVSVVLLMVIAVTVVPASAAQEPVQLTGRTTFAGVFTDSGFVFSPADVNFCDASGTIVREEGGTLELEVTECGGFRTCTWEFTVTDGGEVSGGVVACVPEPEAGAMVSLVEQHTGCTVGEGTFPVYVGTWDGSTLSAAGDFASGPCEGGVLWGDAAFWEAVDDPEGYLDDGVTADDGPAHITFGIDISVIPAAQTLPVTGGDALPIQAVLLVLGGLAVAAGLGARWLSRRVYKVR